MLSLFNSALALIYPESCCVCGADGTPLCERCIDEFRAVDDPDACPLCGRALSSGLPCGSCSTAKLYFSRGTYGFYYERALREAVHAFKFNGRKEVGRRLVRLAGNRIASLADRFDVIVPVPVSKSRLKERGFNQSYIIAEEITGITGKELDHRALVKHAATRDQFSLSRKDRRKNIKGAFKVIDPSRVKGRAVLLVDDLFTTGYTASEAAKTLRSAGAADVILFALARTS